MTPSLDLRCTERWRAVAPLLLSNSADRDPETTRQVIAQFGVEANPRYQKQWNERRQRWDTFCNIFAWDVTTALGCEIPHWVTGPLRELTANAVCDWLAGTPGAEAGWVPATIGEATEAARRGRPAVATYKAPVGSGHIAVLWPHDGPETLIAQAGNACFQARPLTHGFGNLPVACYIHR